MSLTARPRPGWGFELLAATELRTQARFSPSAPAVLDLASGTGANQIDTVFADGARSLGASTSESLDLAGALENPLGGAAVFAKVKGIYVRAAASNGGNIVLGGAASNAFIGPFADASDKLEIPAGGYVELVAPGAGWTVTASTGDLLKLENDDSGAAAVFDIVIIGTSA